MTANLGFVDRFLRLLLAAGLLYLGLGILGGSTLGIVLAIVAAIPLLTAIVGVCPLYSLLGLNTAHRNRPRSSH
jgi:hypothetical protein